MFDSVFNETIPAWNERSLVPDATDPQLPDLRLLVILDNDEALTVEVAEGVLESTDCTLYLERRGAFEVTASLRRQVGGRERVYLRMRPTKSGASEAA